MDAISPKRAKAGAAVSDTERRAAPDVISGDIPFVEDFLTLQTHADERGALTEIYREDWDGLPPLRQWNFVRNAANVMRGMHVHPVHADYLVILEGELLLALHDIRPASPTRGARGVVRLTGDTLTSALIQPGVVHGFYIPYGNVMVYGLTQGWDLNDEIVCRWDDPDLGLQWPAITDPLMSDRDANGGSFAQLVKGYEAAVKA